MFEVPNKLLSDWRQLKNVLPLKVKGWHVCWCLFVMHSYLKYLHFSLKHIFLAHHHFHITISYGLYLIRFSKLLQLSFPLKLVFSLKPYTSYIISSNPGVMYANREQDLFKFSLFITLLFFFCVFVTEKERNYI